MDPTEVGWGRLVDALVRVEEVTNTAGLFAFGNDAGGIFVESGRICWVAASGKQERLRELLRGCALAHDPDRAAVLDLDALYHRCVAAGTHLGQTLVEEGWITAPSLELALRRHSAESLAAMCHPAAAPPVWTPRRERGYSPRFTFRPLDVLVDVVALYIPHLQELARAELAPLVTPDRRGAAFCFDETYELAVPVAVFGDLSVHDLELLGNWAARVPLATRELGATPTFTLAATTAGDTNAVWWQDELLYAVACNSRYSVATLASYHLARRS
ncbi:MAG TPA: hypothetical protein VGC41_27900 [Kofleriaceae bacterium]